MLDDAPIPPLPERPSDGHKGTFGTVGVVGGFCAADQPTMLGGPCLSAIGALRAGAGLCRLALPESLLAHGLTIAPSATGVALPVDHERALIAHASCARLDELLGSCACVAIGPGLGSGDGARALSLRAVNQDETPIVVDADAIKALSELPEVAKDVRAPAIFTPHPGEYRGLAATLGIDADPVDEEARPAACEAMARQFGCVVVLKGAGTIVSDGLRTWRCDAREPALATAGTGDVLTGLLAGLVAQHHRAPIVAGERTVTSERLGGLSLYDIARIGVRAHAQSAALWRERTGATHGLLAEELAELIPRALATLDSE
ncbi:MAG: NAD(P)H-hydrate dehydratase [Planctomycetota bacterium]